MGDAHLLEHEARILADVARRGLVLANRAIHTRAQRSSDVQWRGCGSTGVIGIFGRNAVGLGHVGDSRIYRMRDGTIRAMTTDHSLENEYIKANKLKHLTEEQIEAIPKNVIVRALGMSEDVDVDTLALDTKAGDVFLFCSDGIWSLFDDAGLVRILKQHGAAAAGVLVQEGSHSMHGNQDNVSAVVITIGAGP
jgi:protein phosphatase